MSRRRRPSGVTTRTDRGDQSARRIRTTPRKVPGSAVRAPCVIFTRPRCASRRAAARAGSSRSRQASPPTSRAASDGQIDPARPDSRRRIARSRDASSSRPFALRARRRHASEQWRTWSQSRAHARRQTMGRPQVAQGLDGRSGAPPRGARARGMTMIEARRTGERHPAVRGSAAGSTLRACLMPARRTCWSRRPEACTAPQAGSSSIPGTLSRAMSP